jgi:energy-coupling factor transporter transmembrane protein EcfT
MKNLIKREVATIILALIFTAISFVLFALIRKIDTDTFSFLQIIMVTFLIAVFVYTLSFLGYRNFSSIFHGRELTIVLIVFTLLSFAVLNIDRSRSFYLIKWVSISGEKGISTAELADKYNLSSQDFSDLSQRVREQKESGTLFESKGKLHLTRAGKAIASVSTFIAGFASLTGYPRT